MTFECSCINRNITSSYYYISQSCKFVYQSEVLLWVVECYLFIPETPPTEAGLWYIRTRGAYLMAWFACVGFHWHFRTRDNALSWTPRCLWDNLKAKSMSLWIRESRNINLASQSQRQGCLLWWEIHPAEPFSPHLSTAQLFETLLSITSLHHPRSLSH